jgi:hypothetical protein
MRTGSYRNARFKGQRDYEYTWFGVGASLPLLTISTSTAVERILKALRRGDAVAMLDLKTHLATRIHALMPDTAVTAIGLVHRLLPKAIPSGDRDLPGHACETSLTESFLTTLGRQAAERYNQF